MKSREEITCERIDGIIPWVHKGKDRMEPDLYDALLDDLQTLKAEMQAGRLKLPLPISTLRPIDWATREEWFAQEKLAEQTIRLNDLIWRFYDDDWEVPSGSASRPDEYMQFHPQALFTIRQLAAAIESKDPRKVIGDQTQASQE